MCLSKYEQLVSELIKSGVYRLDLPSWADKELLDVRVEGTLIINDLHIDDASKPFENL